MFDIAHQWFLSEAGKGQSFELDDEGVAGLFGLELARLNYLWSGCSVYGVTRD